jgi:hypothetical protein
MDGAGSGGDKLFGRFTEPAHRVMDLARAEAERAGHRYLGPEHVLLGLLADSHSRAAGVLRAHGVDLAAARAALVRLAERGVVPAPRPSDAELLGTLGIDLDAVRHDTEHAFGDQVVGEATWRMTRRRGWGGAGGWYGRRCVARRWSPSGPYGWPANRPKPWATTRSGPSTCSWASWMMLASPRTWGEGHGGMARSPPTSACATATTVRPACC